MLDAAVGPEEEGYAAVVMDALPPRPEFAVTNRDRPQPNADVTRRPREGPGVDSQLGSR